MLKLDRKSKTLAIGEIIEWNEAKKINLNPSYQRKSAWSSEQMSFLIDSILRNYPIPPIFLRTNLDSVTGKAKYDVIDGKQRLTSIFKFIAGEISSSSNDAKSDSDSDELDGISFEDLKSDNLKEVRSHFWSYDIPVEYVTSDDTDIIDHVFDRLNRNGERLNGQELRNSQYYDTKLLKFVKEKAESSTWMSVLANLKTNRLEDHELVSELLFLVIEKKILDSSEKGRIDELYEKHKEFSDDHNSTFEEVSSTFFGFGLGERLNILGVSHIYGLWSLAEYCTRNNISSNGFKEKLEPLYAALSKRGEKSGDVLAYKNSMISNTKSASKRNQRLDALKKIVGIS
ncbi:DUF262 domain-containing protein [Leptothrix ochracea]|uniref:DUF262 domain-containing protein n=1 Tax=Leptothrix ochracea TaxID=735331 RepID=UPI0034E2F668